MNDVFNSFYHPRHEYIDFSTNNLIAKFGFWFLEPGRAVFGRKVVVFDKDNIPSFETIEKPIKPPIVAVALRIILWIPTSFGILCLELARVTSTQFKADLWKVRKAYVMDILDHAKLTYWKEREITASKICRFLSYNEMGALTAELQCNYFNNQDKRVGSQAAFMRYEVVARCDESGFWCLPDVELEKLRFASMNDKAVIKYVSLSPSLPYVYVLCHLPPDRQQSILNQLKFDKKMVELLSDLSRKRHLPDQLSVDFIPPDSRESLVKIVNERFADYIINNPSPITAINEFKECIFPSIGSRKDPTHPTHYIDFSWIFAEKHRSLLGKLLNRIGHDKRNEIWLFSLAQLAFNNQNLNIFLSLLTKEQICLLYEAEPLEFDWETCYQIKMASFNLILKCQVIRSKLTGVDFQNRIYPKMRTIYSFYPKHRFPHKELRNQDEYKFLFSPCGGDIEVLRHIPCSLLKIYLDAVKEFYSIELWELTFIGKLFGNIIPKTSLEEKGTITWKLVIERIATEAMWKLTEKDKEKYKNVFQLHLIPPKVQEKLQSLGSGIQEIIQKIRNDYLEHFNTILYLDELVFLKIYHGILTKEEKAYILELSREKELSHEEPEGGWTHIPHSLQIKCTKFLHENPDSMKQEKCNDGMLALINTYKSLSSK